MDGVYKAFIASIEKIDSTASLGFRGRKIPQLQLSEEYLVVQSALTDFIKVAEEAAEIPVQYNDWSSEKVRWERQRQRTKLTDMMFSPD